MAEEKPREIAARLLSQRSEGRFIEDELDQALARSHWRVEDRRLVQELVFGVTRWRLTLDRLIDRKTNGSPQKPLVRAALSLGLYQMFWLDRVPSYAAVNEAVEICKRAGHAPQARFVNAVLRGYGREQAETRRWLDGLRDTDLSLAFSHPAWLCQRWTQRWGRERTLQLLEWNNLPPPTFARVNTLKTTPEALRKIWQAEPVEFTPAEFDWAAPGTVFQLQRHPPLAQLESFGSGLFYIQDPSTLLASTMLDPQPGEEILDLCAAPGGKTTHLAALTQNQGRISASDIDAGRLELVRENTRRLGASCVTLVPKDSLGEARFDRVLVDAPCSNTGVMRRRVELRWRVEASEVLRLAEAQLALLSQASRATRPGGTLLYSTCSLEQEENQAVVEKFLAGHPQFVLEAERQLTPFGQTPFGHGVDGAYCAKFRCAPRV